MPLGILLDYAHPMSLLPQLTSQLPTLPDSAVDELRKDVSVRLLYMFPENADLSGLRSTAAGVGQLIDLSAVEYAHLLSEARRVIYKVYIDEMQWQFGDNTPSGITRVKAHSVVGTLLEAKKKANSPLSIELPTTEEDEEEHYIESDSEDEDDAPCETPCETDHCGSLSTLSADSSGKEEDEEKSPIPSSPEQSSPVVSRRNSVSCVSPASAASTPSSTSSSSSSFDFDASTMSSLQVPPRKNTPSPAPPARRPSFLKNSELVMNGVADKFDEHAVWCLAIVDDERFDPKRQKVSLSPPRRLSIAAAHGDKNLLLLHSRVVGCFRILVRENCPDKKLEIEGYLSEKRNAAVLRRLQDMGSSNDPLQRVEFQRLVEINRLAILKEYRGLSLSDDLFGMGCIYASERSSSIISSSSFKSGYEKFKRLGKHCVEMGELRYEDHDPRPCGVVVLQLPVLLLLNRVSRYVLFVLPRRYWRYVHYPRRFLLQVLAVCLLAVLIAFLYSYRF